MAIARTDMLCIVEYINDDWISLLLLYPIQTEMSGSCEIENVHSALILPHIHTHIADSCKSTHIHRVFMGLCTYILQ